MHDLEEELQWLVSEDYYFPTWKEVRDYVDGKLLLPEKSIVLCFDDGAKSFLEVGIPALEKYEVPATCFMITKGAGEEKVKNYPSKYVSYQSHSDNMHRAGGFIGHGGIFTAMPEEEALADLKTSIEKCGNSDAFAYPYGDYTQQCRDIVEEAGFLCAVTTEGGKAKPGMDPLLLPRVRMSRGRAWRFSVYGGARGVKGWGSAKEALPTLSTNSIFAKLFLSFQRLKALFAKKYSVLGRRSFLTAGIQSFLVTFLIFCQLFLNGDHP